MRNIMIDIQNSDTWKIQLTIAINFIFSKDAESLRSRYQGNLETSMEGSDFIFGSGQLMYYKCHKVNFGLGVSYIDYPDWIEKKKATINPKNKYNKCFQYTVTVALRYVEFESHLVQFQILNCL